MTVQTWTHFYSDRRFEVTVFDNLTNETVFGIDSEEVLENGLDKMTDEEQRQYILENFQDVITDNIESKRMINIGWHFADIETGEIFRIVQEEGKFYRAISMTGNYLSEAKADNWWEFLNELQSIEEVSLVAVDDEEEEG